MKHQLYNVTSKPESLYMPAYNKTKQLLKKLKPEIEKWLKSNVTEKRFKHIERVAKTARKYAKKMKLDYYKAELSGWLHDCAKDFSNERLMRMARLYRIDLDEVDYINPHILHARIGAIIAKEKFKIRDPEVLGGIRCHTLAEPNMSKLEMVVYLADATEPARQRQFAAPVRRIFKDKGLEPAVLKAIDNKLLEVLKRKKSIHPLTIKARNWLIEQIERTN